MRVFIENEAGSRRKHVYDERTLALVHTVDVSASYPFPYGFVLGTRGGDEGDYSEPQPFPAARSPDRHQAAVDPELGDVGLR